MSNYYDNNDIGVSEDGRGTDIGSIIAVFLIVCGAVCVSFVLYAVYALLAETKSVELIQMFANLDDGSRSLILDGGRNTLEIPESVFLVIGHFIYVVALMVSSGIAKTLIVTGVSLIRKSTK